MTSNRYGPVGRFGITYVPLSLVTTVRVKPVSICVTVTLTPGSTALLSSVTRPLSSAVACAHAGAVARRTSNAARHSSLTRFIASSLVSRFRTDDAADRARAQVWKSAVYDETGIAPRP